MRRIVARDHHDARASVKGMFSANSDEIAVWKLVAYSVSEQKHGIILERHGAQQLSRSIADDLTFNGVLAPSHGENQYPILGKVKTRQDNTQRRRSNVSILWPCGHEWCGMTAQKKTLSTSWNHDLLAWYSLPAL